MIRGTFFNPSWWNRREYKESFWSKERMAEKEEIRRETAELIRFEETGEVTLPNPAIRFLLFRYEAYYPGGGMQDLVGKYATVEEARANAKVYDSGPIMGEWTEHEIYDTWTGEDVPVIAK